MYKDGDLETLFFFLGGDLVLKAMILYPPPTTLGFSLFFFFPDRFSLSNNATCPGSSFLDRPCWPNIHRGLAASATSVLGLKSCTITARLYPWSFESLPSSVETDPVQTIVHPLLVFSTGFWWGTPSLMVLTSINSDQPNVEDKGFREAECVLGGLRELCGSRWSSSGSWAEESVKSFALHWKKAEVKKDDKPVKT